MPVFKTSERKAAACRENGRKGGRPRTHMMIRAAKTAAGYYQLVADNGDIPQEGTVHLTAKEAYEDAALLWPAGFPWFGKRIPGGYKIYISELKAGQPPA